MVRDDARRDAAFGGACCLGAVHAWYARQAPARYRRAGIARRAVRTSGRTPRAGRGGYRAGSGRGGRPS